ncbi:hypothetical protein DFR67_108245 [Williamsia limnetica]|uniref:Uncharacterized protein n=1 Tax=Williamsia limnetica TaxID=882452 RepID=A0A318RNR2_WILLI|nr:hypothetical protein [Williamsia limnetica]PYE16492.1 hypothetical protein DFR67_108245 [Williamsia limnetica]
MSKTAWAIGHPKSRPVLALLATLLMTASMLVAIAFAGSANSETPAERCARETAAYHAAWVASWSAANPGSDPSQAPPPPVPHVCRDPGEAPTTTPTSPELVAPGIPTTAPEIPTGPNVGAHAPTDIPAPGATPIVPVPGGPQTRNGLVDLPTLSLPDVLADARHDADANYPTNEILGTYEDQCGNQVPLRRGYYNAGTDKGRGWDKIFHKHKMTERDVVKQTIESQCGKLDENDTRGRTLIYEKQFWRKECHSINAWQVRCEGVPPPITFRTVVQMEGTLPGGEQIPDGKPQGVVTGYCVGMIECPQWMSSRDQIDKVNGISMNPEDEGGQRPPDA